MPRHIEHGDNHFRINITDFSEDLIHQLDTAVSQVVRKTTLDISADAKSSLSGPKSGRIYGGHQASAPGEAPATWSGDLAGSFEEHFPTANEGVVAVKSDHAAPMEFGTAYIAPRPFLGPAVERHREPFFQALKQVFKRGPSL